MRNFLIKDYNIKFDKNSNIIPNLKNLNLFYQLIISETQNMIRYKQNTQNKEKIEEFLGNISFSIKVFKAIEKLGTSNVKLDSIEKEEKFRNEIEEIKKKIKKNNDTGRDNYKDSNKKIINLKAKYENKNKGNFFELFSSKLNVSNRTKASKTLKYIKSYQKSFLSKKGIDELKRCKKFYSEKINPISNNNNNNKGKDGATNIQVLQILYYMIKVNNSINKNSSQDSIFMTSKIESLKKEIETFLNDNNIKKMENVIDKFNESVRFLKKSDESLLYLLYFNYNILQNIQNKIDEFIKDLKGKDELGKDFTKIIKKINNGND